MRIYFIRHGHPNYAEDRLTELGHLQAEACARRLANSGIERIYASTMGRAMQTAEYTARRLGLDVVGCDFMRETAFGPLEGEEVMNNGHPWAISDTFVSMGKPLEGDDWYEREPYCRTKFPEGYRRVVEGLAGWLAELGYRREGDYYRAVGDDLDRSVAMFSHGGSSTVVLSAMTNIPMPTLLALFHPDFTGITVVELRGDVGELCYPLIRVMNDARHIEGVTVDNVYGE